jgi:Peptidase family M28
LDSPRGPGVRRIVLSAVMLAAIFALTLMGFEPPAPKSANARATEFSAVRAGNTLDRILGGDLPHPLGSPANDTVRGHIVDELTALGYQPQVQTAFACGEYGGCGTVNNVVARLDGADPDGGAVLLAAHYDSVAAGPGDSDDGTGVAAVLEIGRALKALPPPRHSIILLLDEGEEEGLLGAQAFVDSHPWAKDVRAAVNLDARGTSGVSILFETGDANEFAVRLYAAHGARPSASSIVYTIYKHTRYDTDFTVFKAAGYQGMNFAYLGGVAQYHTPLDNSSNVSLASLQHHGENALPSIVALAQADFSSLPVQEAVFFDVLGRWIIHWPARRSLAFAVGVFLLLLAQIAWMIRSRRLTPGAFVWGLIGWPLTMAITGALALVLALAIRFTGATPVDWIAHPLPLEIAFGSLAASLAIPCGIFFTRRAGFWGLWSGVWSGWALLAVAVSWRVPGVSYVVLIPAGIAALTGLPFTLRRADSGPGSILPVILPLATAAIVGFGPAILSYEGFGTRALAILSLVVAFLLTPIAPLCVDLQDAAGFRATAVPWIPILATGLAVFAAVVAPVYSAKVPERVNIKYWQDADSGTSQWIVQPDSGRLSEPIRLAATFRRADRGALPWDLNPAFVADAPHLDLAAPTFTILEASPADGRRSYRALLRSERGAPFAAVFFPPDAGVESVTIGGHPVRPSPTLVRQHFNGWAVYFCPAISPGGVEIGFTVPIGKPIEVSAADQSYGLPSEGTFLLNSRPLTATPSGSGDTTIVTRRVQLLP